MKKLTSSRYEKRLMRRSAAAAYCGLSQHKFDALVAAGVITPILLPMQKQARFDKQQLDHLIELGRSVGTSAGMPESMPGKARNFADFLKKIEGTDNANH